MITASDTAAKPVGAVLVVGGGIAGIQAAMDLSASGYKAYLLETSSALGGHMAMLDKTFPTNDCSMCTMSPRLVSLAQDNNIEILTLSDLLKLEGCPGNFTATVRVRPRFVDPDKCTGCGECVDVCPVKLPSEFNQGLDERTAIHRMYPQAVPHAFVIEREERPRCMQVCPIGTNPQGYIALVREGRYHEALRTLRDTNPLPSICGRVCHHPCEASCGRAAIDEPVGILSIKRFLVDYCATHPADPELQAELDAGDLRAGRGKADPTGKRVAVVGSGPAGLAAADYLARKGHEAVIFEMLSAPGGMLRVGIPDFRLPTEVLDRDIQAICDLGVAIRCGQRLGKDFTLSSLSEQGFDATLVAIGASGGRDMKMPGEDAPNVLDGIEFLRAINLGERVQVGPRVAVIGGGNVAVDVARASRRLGGAKTTILYRRSEAEMPALDEEIEHARLEGIEIELLTNPVKVITDAQGNATALECVRMELGEPDESGRRRPVPIEGSEFTIEVDTAIKAIGQEVLIEDLDKPIETKWGRPAADPITLATSIDGIFAAGDAVTGPDTVTTAMAQGRRAAISVDNYLADRPLDTGQTAPAPLELGPAKPEDLREPGNDTSVRQHQPVMSPTESVKSFQEVVGSLEEAAALAEASRCLNCGVCSDCQQCVRACEAGAINLNQQVAERQIEIGGVILADGHKMYDATRRGEYGYKRYPNVVSSLEFERLLSASGPSSGRVTRPGDGKEAKRVAFIQCVGSRDASDHGNEYCSGVCCMYTTKAAMIGMDHDAEMAATIFMIDMRAHGKGYETYYQRAEALGVRYLRSMVSAVRQDFATGDLTVAYAAEDGTNHTETFDMVVLSLGLECQGDSAKMAEMLGVELDEYGFIDCPAETPVETARPGVLVCGTTTGPKDIPDSVTEASAAAAVLGMELADARFTCITKPEYPPQRDISAEPIRVGVFICHCGNNIAGVVDVQELVERARKLPDVVFADRNLYTCAPDGLAMIRETIERENLNRVVVASCTCRTHAAIFQDALLATGLNKYLFEMANIRDQCSWVHASEPAAALDKADDLLRSTVAKARLLQPLEEHTQTVEHGALVIGGGLAGMVAATNLAAQGFSVALIERGDALGGQLRHIRHTLEGRDVTALMDRMVARVTGNEQITLHLDSIVRSHDGSVGKFESIIAGPNGTETTVRHGTTIVATGAEMYEPTEYGHGESDKIVTQRELEQRLEAGQADSLDSVVMIQCVGCRNEERTYCSRICCAEAVKNALELKERNPAGRVTIAYKDVRTFGRMEKYYHQARNAGVYFVRYDDDHAPDVGPDGKVKLWDPSLDRELDLDADLVVLSAAVVARPEDETLAETLRVPRTLEGFFLEAHIKLRPVDFACEGIFLAGLAHGPKFIGETIAQALATAGRAAAILSKDRLVAGGAVATVDQDICAACLSCVRVCPYSVPRIENGLAVIEPTACQGCGVCSAECPAGAISLQYFTEDQMRAAVSGLFDGPDQTSREVANT